MGMIKKLAAIGVVVAVGALAANRDAVKKAVRGSMTRAKKPKTSRARRKAARPARASR